MSDPYVAIPDPDGELTKVLRSLDYWVTAHTIMEPQILTTAVFYRKDLENVLDLMCLTGTSFDEVETDNCSVTLIDLDQEEVVKGLREASSKISRKAYAKMCSDRDRIALRRAQDEMEQLKRALPDMQQRLVKAERDYKDLLRDIRRLKTRQTVDMARLEAEFDKLCQMPGLVGVTVSGDDRSLTVTTEPVSIEHEGVEYYIGEFEIKIYLDGRVECSNSSGNLRNDRQHPHISGSSSICYGNMAELTRYISDYQFDVAVMMFLKYLNSYNEADPFQKIECWGEEDCGDMCDGCHLNPPDEEL